MKKFTLIIIFAIIGNMLMAQEQAGKNIRYRGVASMGMAIDLKNNDTDAIMVSTTHGACIDNKTFYGGGLGLKYLVTNRDYEDFDYDKLQYRTKYLLSVYFDLGHDFGQIGKFVPYTEVKCGYDFNIYEDDDSYYYDNLYVGGMSVMPMVGIRFSHSSIWAGYNFVDAKYSMTEEQKNCEEYLHYLAFGISMNFGR